MHCQVLSDVAFDTIQIGQIATGSDGNCDAGSACSARSAYAMDVILRIARQVVVDDMADPRDVESSGCDVGRHQEPDLAVAQVHHGAVPFALSHIPVQSFGRQTLLAEIAGQGVGISLGGREYDRFRHGPIGAQVLEQTVLVLEIVGHVQTLFDPFMGQLARCDVDPFRVLNEFLGEPGGRLSHGGREQEGLAFFRHGLEDEFHVVDEPHVKHAIGFVQYEQANVGDIDTPAPDVIDESPRRRDDHGRRLSEGPDLVTEGHASVNSHAVDIEVFSIGTRRLRYLAGQFPRGSEDQDAQPMVRPGGQRRQPLEGRKHKGSRLARSSLSGGDEVAPREHFRNGLSLYRGGAVMAARGKGLENGWS